MPMRGYQPAPSAAQSAAWAAIGVDLLRGTMDLHDAQVVHRDPKPGNVIVGTRASGRRKAVIVDRGLGKIMAPLRQRSGDLDELGALHAHARAASAPVRGGTAEPPSGPLAAPATPAAPRRRGGALAAIVVVAVVLGAGLGYAAFRLTPPASAPTPAPAPTPTD